MRVLEAALSRNVDALFDSIEGVRDGDAEAIHRARVATRRLRAVLPIALSGSPEAYVDDSLQLVRRAGRLLGRARDLDVALVELGSMERRIPGAARVLSALRADLVVRHAKGRRRLVKGLDALPLFELRSLPRRGPFRGLLQEHTGRRTVQTAVAEQAGRVQAAVVSAAGVYMPRRTHVLRIETKKLRYLLEPFSRKPDVRSAIKQLKRVQEILGALHDRQALIERVKVVDGPERERMAILAVAEEDCRDLFRAYVEQQREGLLRVCAGAVGDISRPGRGLQIAAATAMAVPSIVWLVRGDRPIIRVVGQILRPVGPPADDTPADVFGARELAAGK